MHLPHNYQANVLWLGFLSSLGSRHRISQHHTYGKPRGCKFETKRKKDDLVDGRTSAVKTL